MKTKICSKCKIEKPIIEFFKAKLQKSGLTCRCKNCIKEYQKIQHKKYYQEHKEERKAYGRTHNLLPKRIFVAIINNSKPRNITINLTENEFINWYTSQEQKCYYCGRTLEEIKNDIKENIRHKNRMSVDRKDNNKGYELNNIVLACMRCNTIKSSYFTEKEMLKIGKLIYCAIDDKQAEENYHNQIK
jgi:5-methylcytosine-specific restriction endonuclease McrA